MFSLKMIELESILGPMVWGAQGLLIAVDEFYFHHRRVVPRWERIGHPVDTFFFLSCFVFCLVLSPSTDLIRSLFIALAIFSCLLISKDEWVHKELSSGFENWLHSLLFIVHPLSLFILYRFWIEGSYTSIVFQTAVISLFMGYQIIYWNFVRKDLTTLR